MINAIIRSDDRLFCYGMMHRLQKLVFQKYGRGINFSHKIEPDSIAYANIIVLVLAPGEKYTCRPELRNRRNGLLILFCKVRGTLSSISECFSGGVILSLTDSLKHIDAAIKEKLNLAVTPLTHLSFHCQCCRARYLSHQQYHIIEGLFLGLSIEHIARQMNLAPKTIYAQKYAIMKKFDLRGDLELMGFYKIERDKYPLSHWSTAKMIMAVQEDH